MSETLLRGKEFRIPPRIIFGAGSLARIGEEAAALGNKTLLVTGRRGMKESGTLARVLKALKQASVQVEVFDQVTPEPTLSCLMKALDSARQSQARLVIGLGGGSALDVAKATAGLAFAKRTPAEYFRGASIEPGERLPFLAVSTTAGTGSEVTPNSVLTDEASSRKASIRHPDWYAKTVLADPELLASLPLDQALASGVDALAHSLESLVSTGANELTVPVSIQAAVSLMTYLPRLADQGYSAPVAAQLLAASLMAGIALANAGLGLVHALAHPLGVLCKAGHGLTCAALLTPVVRFNFEPGRERYTQVARMVDLSLPGQAESGLSLPSQLDELLNRLGLPASPASLGITREQAWRLVRELNREGSFRYNPRPASDEELVGLLMGEVG